MHPRTRLRNAAKAALAAAFPGLRVSGVRTFARNREGLPAIEVTTPGESVETVNGRGGFLREASLVVLLYGLSTEIEDELDAIAELVEAVLPRDSGILAVCEHLRLDRSDFDPGDGGEGRPGRLAITFTARAVK